MSHERPSAIDAWRQRVRPLLRDRVRPDPYRSVTVEPLRDAKAATVEGATPSVWRLHIDETWTLPLLEYDFDRHVQSSSPSSTRRGGTTIVLCDGALAETASVVKTFAAPGARVLLANILFTGECEADVELPGDQVVRSARWIYAQLLNSAGSRPLGIQVAQFCALIDWSGKSHRNGPTQLVAKGRVSSLAALIVAALNPGKLDRISLQGMPGQWRGFLQAGVTYPDAPSFFCFGLAELVEVNDLIQLAAAHGRQVGRRAVRSQMNRRPRSLPSDSDPAVRARRRVGALGGLKFVVKLGGNPCPK